MTERRVTETQRPAVDREGHVNVTVERNSEGTIYRAEPRQVTAAQPYLEQRTTAVPAPRDRVRWGPILAGLVATIASMLVLTVLGLALGASVFEPTSDGSDVGAFAAIWSALSALVPFLIGGWVTGKTASLHGDDNALLNGALVGASALALILWLASMGAGNLLGGLGNNIDEIARVGRDTVTQQDVNSAADSARTNAVAAYDEARNSAWGTLAGIVLALGASAVGALLGHKSRDTREVIRDEGAAY